MTWAAVAAAGASIVGSVGAGYLGSQASDKAASAAAKGQRAAIAAQMQMYQQGRQDQAPYRYVGGQALNVLARTYGLDPYTGQMGTYNPQATSSASGGGGGGKGNPLSPANVSQLSIGAGLAGGLDPVTGTILGGSALNNMLGLGGGDNHAGREKRAVQRAQGLISGSFTPDQIEGLNPKAKAALNKVITKLGYNPLDPNSVALMAHPTGAPGTYADPTAPAPGPGNLNYFQTSPDYQFRQQEGINALDRSAAARGMLLSGAQSKGVTDFSSNIAAGEFGNWYNRMANLAGIGQTATNQTGAYGMNAGNQIADYNQNMGFSRASGYLGQGNAWGQAINQGVAGIGNALGSYFNRNQYDPYNAGYE